MARRQQVEVAIVGGGPAGAALATRLALSGREVVLFERLAAPRWRAGGVYSSPLTRRRLASLGLATEQLDALIRPIAGMVVRSADGRASARLEYEPPATACGLDRVRLEEVLLGRAALAGASVQTEATVRQVHIGDRASGLLVSSAHGPSWWHARLVVGADGPSSLVARAAGVSVASRRFRRAALTGHRADEAAPPAGRPMDAQMIVGKGWYLGIAPVPGARVNLGYVLGEPTLRRRLAEGSGLEALMDDALRQSGEGARRWLAARATDELQAHLPLAHRVRRAAGPGFLLVGDAAGFLDPLSGEGLHRALMSAHMAALAIERWAAGDRMSLSDYDRRLRARFRSKDVVSWLLQLFLLQPDLTRYALARLGRRGDTRQILARGLADLSPASKLLDPRFHVRMLAP